MVAIPTRKLPQLMAITAAAVLASCAYPSSSPRQVSAENPSVTYNYRTDSELLQASQKAATYCGQYQSVERTERITNNSDGSKMVVFDCVKTGPVAANSAPVPSSPPGMTYTYRNDQELLDASRNAQGYCMRNGMTALTSNTVSNVDGSRTVTFQCGPTTVR
jgi:hypothetical protein